jgi:hypothetical protein
MLLQLLPEQVANYWDIVKFAVEESFPPTVKTRPDMNKILESLLGGSMIAWVSIDDNSKKILGIVTTTISEDICTGTKNLVIYSVYALAEKVGRKNWADGYEAIMKYAKSLGCTHVVGYTKVNAIKQVAKFFGADIDWTLISIDVK